MFKAAERPQAPVAVQTESAKPSNDSGDMEVVEAVQADGEEPSSSSQLAGQAREHAEATIPIITWNVEGLSVSKLMILDSYDIASQIICL